MISRYKIFIDDKIKMDYAISDLFLRLKDRKTYDLYSL